MAMNAYLKVKGAKQGDIKGSVIRKGLEGQIQVIAVLHEIISPRDAASGQATGKRQHKPIVITKEIDRSTPLLRQALVTNERLTECQLQFYTGSSSGAERCYFTIKLTDASITSASFVMPNAKPGHVSIFGRYNRKKGFSIQHSKINTLSAKRAEKHRFFQQNQRFLCWSDASCTKTINHGDTESRSFSLLFSVFPCLSGSRKYARCF